MTVSSVKANNVFARAGQYIKRQAEKSGNYLKDTKADTVEFVKGHPKATATAVGVGAAVVIVGAVIKKAVEAARQRHFQKEVIKTVIEAQNDAQKAELTSIVHRQASKIKTMKSIIKTDKEMLAANHDAIEAARGEIAKLKANKA